MDAERLLPDVILVDLELPGRPGSLLLVRLVILVVVSTIPALLVLVYLEHDLRAEGHDKSVRKRFDEPSCFMQICPVWSRAPAIEALTNDQRGRCSAAWRQAICSE